MFKKFILTGSCFVLLSGCASHGLSPQISGSTAANTAVEPRREDIYYHLIVAEMAAHRNQADISIANYLRATELSPESQIAERATRMAFYAKDHASAYRAAKRWFELAPENNDALQAVAALALLEGDAAAALEHVKQVLHSEEEGLLHGFQVVASLLARGRGQHDDQALEIMAKIVSEHPDNAYAHLAYGELATLLGRYPKAEAALNKSLGIEPELQAALISHARLIYQMGRPEEALAHLSLAIADIEDNEKLRLAYGRMLLEAKRYRQAKKQFTILSQAAPEDSDYLYTLALLALDMDEVDQAELHLKRLLQLGERVSESHYYLGRIAESRQEYENAINQYQVVGRSEYQFDAQIRVGELLALTGQIEAGLVHIRSLRMHNPESSIAIRLYVTESSILAKANRYEDAIDVLSEALSAVSGNTDLLYSRALLYEKVNKINLLEQDLRAVLLREPENADALNALGYTLADRTDRFNEAYELIQQALKLKPDEAAIIDSMGWVLYRLGRNQEAITYLKRALALQYDSEIAGHLSEVLWVVGQRNAAKKLLESALEKSPDDKGLLHVKEQLDASQNDN